MIYVNNNLFVSELLLANKQSELAVEAMRELANLHFHAGNIR